MIAVREFSSGAECIAHAHALRQKFYRQPPKPKPFIRIAKKVETVDIPAFLHLQPLWKKQHIFFDAHMYAWREELVDRACPLKAYIKRRAAQLGFTYGEMITRGRERDRIEAKHLIMWEIKRIVKPDASFPEIGRLFGGMDHTSVMSAVKKIDRQKASKLRGISE